MSTQIVEVIAARRARRAYDTRPVDRTVLERIMQAAHLAPSCANKQSWRFLVCDSDPARQQTREALTEGNYWALAAPVLVVVTTADSIGCRLSDDRNYAQFDAGMATMNLMLQATHEGLYAHPMAGFEPAKIRAAFGIEPDTRVVTVIAIGYPGNAVVLNAKHAESEVADRDRKPLSAVVMWNEWSAIA